MFSAAVPAPPGSKIRNHPNLIPEINDPSVKQVPNKALDIQEAGNEAGGYILQNRLTGTIRAELSFKPRGVAEVDIVLPELSGKESIFSLMINKTIGTFHTHP